jgi:hypothetical protein
MKIMRKIIAAKIELPSNIITTDAKGRIHRQHKYKSDAMQSNFLVESNFLQDFLVTGK